MRVGIVAEGRTDHLVLEAFVRATLGSGTTFVRLQPESSRSFEVGGWTEVRRWCNTNAANLEAVMRAVAGLEIHVLVVHMDCDVAPDLGITCTCPPATACAEAVRATVGGWLGGPRPWLVHASPAQKTEAWVVAALFPLQRARPDLECDRQIEQLLVTGGHLKIRRGRVLKTTRMFEPLARAVFASAADVCAACPEAEGFRTRLIAATPLA